MKVSNIFAIVALAATSVQALPNPEANALSVRTPKKTGKGLTSIVTGLLNSAETALTGLGTLSGTAATDAINIITGLIGDLEGLV